MRSVRLIDEIIFFFCWSFLKAALSPLSITFHLFYFNSLYAEALVGDTNLFINQDYFLAESDNDEADQERSNDECIVAEAEIMIAEPAARGKGYGKEAILLMLKYGYAELDIQEFVSKIGYQNKASQNLFKKLQFEEQSRSDVFQEITFKRSVDTNWMKWVNEEVVEYEVEDYVTTEV